MDDPNRMEGKRQCTATAKGSGQRCKRAPIPGGMVCKKHGGGAKQVRAKAAQRLRDILAEAIDPDRAMLEAARLAYSNIQELFDEKGKLLPIKQWPEDVARAVKSLETVRGNVDKGDGQFDEVVKVQLWDKPRKIENLMKHHGKLVEKHDHNVTVDVVHRLTAARQRAVSAAKELPALPPAKEDRG